MHVSYVENNLGILAAWKKRHFNYKLVGTVHQPPSWYEQNHRNPGVLSKLDAIIVLGSRFVPWFERYLPGKVYFIPHGVDIHFFSPIIKNNTKTDYCRCVFCGRWLRDIDTLARIIDKVILRNPRIKFDLVIPISEEFRNTPVFSRLSGYEQVSFHIGLPDEEYREVLSKANMLVLPLLDCIANNTVVEAIACGLPVISNDVGGIRDYTKDSFADLFPAGDADAMAERILRLADSPVEQEARGKAARKFAEENFSWKKIAQATLEIYGKV